MPSAYEASEPAADPRPLDEQRREHGDDGERVGQRRFARLHVVVDRGQDDVRLDAAMLGALAGNTIELADGHGQLAVHRLLRPAIQRDQVLHRALAEGALAETKPIIARYFAEHVATEARGLKASATAGAGLLYALSSEALTGF